MLAVRDLESPGRRRCVIRSFGRWPEFVSGHRAGGHALEVVFLGSMQDWLLGVQRLGGPPVDGIATLDVVDDESDAHHEATAKDHDWNEEPANGEEAVVDDG